jgi:hypothetical protein
VFVFSWPEDLDLDLAIFVALLSSLLLGVYSACSRSSWLPSLFLGLGISVFFFTLFWGVLASLPYREALFIQAPLLTFPWGSFFHGFFLLFWRDLSLLIFYHAQALSLATADILIFLSAGVFWASLGGAVWALSATTPPLLWAADKIEIATLLGGGFLVLGTHLWPLLRGGFDLMIIGFPGVLLALQGVGA